MDKLIKVRSRACGIHVLGRIDIYTYTSECKQKIVRFILMAKEAAATLPLAFIALVVLAVASCSSISREHHFGGDMFSRHYFTLANGLPVLVYHDKRLPVTTVVATVADGTYSDPSEYPGLHHLLEHLVLFEEGKSQQNIFAYANSMGGNAAAFTSEYRTTFEVIVPNHSASTALKILARSLRVGEYSPAAIHSEVKAVHNEFIHGLESDELKHYSVFAHVNNLTGHENFGFQGNESTLLDSGILPLSRDLKDLHSQLYTAKNIALVIYTGEDAETIKSAIKSSFQKIPRGVKKIRHSGKIFTDASSAAKITTELKSRGNEIVIEFPISSKLLRQGEIGWPDLEFVADALSSRMAGGLTERLVSNQLTDHLSVDYQPYPIDSDGHIRLRLFMPKSANNREEEIATNLFGYIKYLQDVYVNQYFSAERAPKTAPSFQYDLSVIDQVNVASKALNYLTVDQIESLFSDSEPSVTGVSNILKLLSPDTMRIWNYRSDPDPKNAQVTRWFKQKYSVSNLSLTSNKSFENDVKAISREFTLQPKDHTAPRILDDLIVSPERIHTAIPSDTWLIHNGLRKSDNGVLVAVINSPFGMRNFKETAAIQLLHRYIMSNIHHALTLRGSGEINFMMNEETNFTFYLQGLNADISADVASLFQYFSDIELSHEKTQNVKSIMLAELEAAPPQSPFDIFANDVFNVGFDREALIKELEQITVSDLELARDTIIETAYLRLFAVGNFSRDEIQALADKLSTSIARASLPSGGQHFAIASMVDGHQNGRRLSIHYPDKNKTGLSVKNIEAKSAESAVFYVDVLYESSSALKANLDVINAFYYHKIIEHFRRERGISYAANSEVLEFRGVAALVTNIASGTSDAEVLLGEIDAFREDFLVHIASLSQEDIDNVSSQLMDNQSFTAVTDEKILQKYHYNFTLGNLGRHDELALERITALKNATPASIKKTFAQLKNAEKNGRRVIIKSIGRVN